MQPTACIEYICNVYNPLKWQTQKFHILQIKKITTTGKFFPVHMKKAYRGTTHTAPVILISVPDRSEWLTSFPGTFTLEKNPRTDWTGNWVGHTVVLNVLENRKTSFRYQNSNLEPTEQIAQSYTNYTNPAPKKTYTSIRI